MTTDPPADDGLRLAGTARTEAFSDGVFAIAITLLVLEIRVPDASQIGEHHGLAGALLDEWPVYLGHLATFLTIGVIWLNHHAFFSKILRIDGVLQWWNLLLLLFVSFIPFPNSLIAEFLRVDLWSGEARVATAVYALVLTASTVPWVFLWSHLIAHPELFEPGFDAAFARRQRPRALVGIAAYAVGVLVALVAPIVAVALFLAAAVFYALTAQGVRTPAA